ncbi:MAG: rhodanese-like domain-containing protein [Candidatus Kapaibacterium sp.]
MKNNTLLREIIVIVGVASLLGLAYNQYASPKKIALIREEEPQLVQADDSALFAPSSSTSSPTAAAGGTQPQATGEPQVPQQQKPKDTVKSTKPTAAPSTATPAATQAPKTTAGTQSTPAAKDPAASGHAKPAAVTYQQVLRLLQDKDVLFIDSRNDEEWAEGHIPGAIHIFADDFQNHIPEVIGLPRDKRIVVYCSGGPECSLSHEVCNNLASFGFNRLFIYFGGWTEWKKMKAEGK